MASPPRRWPAGPLRRGGDPRGTKRVDIPPVGIHIRVGGVAPLRTSTEVPMKTLSLTIEGMSCGHCLNAVNRSLALLRGVAVQSVVLGRATVSYDPAAIGAGEISAAVEAAGYRVAASSE